MSKPRYAGSALLASVLIGPLVGTAVAIAVATDGDGWALAWLLPILVLLGTPVGFVISILPNLIGSALLAWAGKDNVGLRLPPMWALAGAAAGWGMFAAIDGNDPQPSGAALVAGIGAALPLEDKVGVTRTV